MRTTIRRLLRERRGGALVMTIVMLSIAAFTVGSIATSMITYSRNAQHTHEHDAAAFLADAGIRAAIVKLNAESDGNITRLQSHGYFTNTTSFTREWGFDTQMVWRNGTNFVMSNGRYNDMIVQAQAAVTLGSGTRSIHALYAHALFAGNSSDDTNYVLKIGGAGSGADFVRGDVYSGNNIDLSGSARLRLPEDLHDVSGDRICDPFTDTWVNAYCPQVFSNPLSQAAFNSYSNSMAANMGNVYNNGQHDFGEAFVDTIGNGVYDVGEPFTDSNGNGRRDPGDSFIDRNSNGVYNAGVDTVVDLGNGRYDAGEEWTEDSSHSQRQNGKYDAAGGYWKKSGSTWTWKTTYTSGSKTYSCASWQAEAYEDVGDGTYNPVGEAYVDQNGVYDVGEQFLDDRNSIYDYGTQAKGRTSGMPSPVAGQRAAPGGDPAIDPPDLTDMYYGVNHGEPQPVGALARWGNDVAVTANDYGTAKAITDGTRPEHIFLRNPPTSGSVTVGGKTIYGRTYTAVYTDGGQRVDDYFLEDPTDSTYNTSPTAYRIAQNDGNRTCTMLLDVKSDQNMKLYYVDGNLYVHNPQVYSMRFRQPGTRITIVANGNITISDEFYYNATYPSNLQYTNMSSTVVNNPLDALCLIALKNPNCPTNSGNIYIGDQQFGTGGSIHAMLYAENDFVDNNINSVDQQFISVFGNMTAGNRVRLNRTVGIGQYRTRLDITLDERIRDGTIIVPGLPHPVGTQRSITIDTEWHMLAGTWRSFSRL
jgi:hypothetical protein